MKFLVMTLSLMGTMAYAVTQLFHTTQDAADSVVALYTAAGAIDHSALPRERLEQQDQLFAAADRAAPLADRYGKADDIDQLTLSAVDFKK